MGNAIREIYATKGILKGFYAGFGSFVLRDIPFSAIQFPLYEMLKIMQIKYYSKNGTAERDVTLPAVLNSVNGAIAGSVAGLITTPLDVVKTRLMTFQQTENGPQRGKVFTELSTIMKKDGILGLFRGASIRMFYLSVGGSAFFGIYEHSRNKISKMVD